MKALILTADGVEDSELLYPYYRLLEEGFVVDIASEERGPVEGKHGYKVPANKAFEDVRADDYDLLFLPGGKGPEKVRLNEHALEVTRQMFNSHKPVAAICHGAQILISAGLVKGRRATCWPGVKDDLKAAGAEYVDDQVVIDGNLITSRGPDDLPAFCKAMLQAASQPAGHD